MPDLYRDEEIENRTLALCLFDVAGITVLNRCSNCPGAARDAVQHRRCPREHLQPNIFRREDPDSKISDAPKSLASSSKQHDSWRHEANTVLPKIFDRLSLEDFVGTAGTVGRSKSDPDIPDGRAELSGTPRISHGVKRQSDLSVPDYLKLKALKPFRDLEPGNLSMPGCWRVPSYEMTALSMSSSAASPMDTQEDRPSGEASSSRPFVAGCCINTLDGYGLLACNDGIEVLGCLDAMEF